MKKSILSLTALATFTTFTLANDAYVGAGLAIQDAGNYDTGVALALNFGDSIDSIEVEKGYFGLEGEFTYSVLQPSLNSQDVPFLSTAGYLTYVIDVNQDVYAKTRLGIGYVSADDIDYEGIRPSLGLALGYKVDKQINFYTGYTILSSMVSNLTFGIEFKL